MSAVRRRTAIDLLCGPNTAPILEYSVVILVHGVSCPTISLPNQESKISVQIARLNEELPLLKTQTISLDKCVFEEVLVVHTETLEELELLLCTSDEVIDEYSLKLGECQVFEYYHITLSGQSSKLFVTLVIKEKHIQPSPPPFIDVQILVQYLETPIQHSKDAVMLAGRDHFESAFYQIPFNSNDKVQVSTPQGPSDQPQWYHTFLFRSCSPAQNLGIYIFHQPRINKENSQWELGDKIGECSLSLDDKLVALLQSNEEGVGFTKVPVVAVQPNLYLKISMKLGVSPALTPNTIPTKTMEWGSVALATSTLRKEAQEKDEPPKELFAKEVSNKWEKAATPASSVDECAVLPDHQAVLELLQRHGTPSSETALDYDEKKDNSTEYMGKIIDQQANELRKYKEAVQKMGRDIIACRDYITSLTAENKKLKSTLAAHRESVHDVSLHNINKDDLVKEVINSRKALREEMEKNRVITETVSSLKDRLTRLESEKVELSELRNAHTSQNKLLQKLQDKVKTTRVLEKTCQNQEKVIERLEGMLDESQPLKRVTFDERLAIMVPADMSKPLAVPKLEPLRTSGSKTTEYEHHVPVETALKLKVKALENQLQYSKLAHQDEMTRLAAEKMDLQLQMARLHR